MRYTPSEKREIIDLVERSSLPVRRTLDNLGIPKSTFYGWYERYGEGGDEALLDGQPRCAVHLAHRYMVFPTALPRRQ